MHSSSMLSLLLCLIFAVINAEIIPRHIELQPRQDSAMMSSTMSSAAPSSTETGVTVGQGGSSGGTGSTDGSSGSQGGTGSQGGAGGGTGSNGGGGINGAAGSLGSPTATGNGAARPMATADARYLAAGFGAGVIGVVGGLI